ncbi:Retrovirus-related Pol polyprotein from transposon RE1 [Sesamum angolense]|uniref:Retrovirus-related Pol polyprotein from transposon RE1 n=1 Tax=Sesamum angolense TaxID=2727404 RepID=A0AAE1T5C3_9LAMI|nr:Retrovirus-related Pol polyprotein from transposon RE1 [Sesamum angolense]
MASSSTEVLIAPTTVVGTGNDVAASRSVRIALEGRDKLSFIDGSNVASPVGTPPDKQWRIADCVAYEQRFNTGPKNFMRRKGLIDKRNLYCDHCHRSGHNRDNYFKIHGTPDLYKDNAGNIALLEMTDPNGNQLISELLEALGLVQNKVPNDLLNVHFAQTTEKAGVATQNFGLADCNSGSWIVDIGATSHMCGDKRLFHSLTTLKTPKRIHIPDNRITQATQCGDVKLSLTLTFANDLKLNRVLALVSQVRKLYFLDKDSFVSVSAQYNTVLQALYSSSELDDFSLWHQRLDHCSPNNSSSVLDTFPISVPSLIVESSTTLTDNSPPTSPSSIFPAYDLTLSPTVIPLQSTSPIPPVPLQKKVIGCKWVFKVKLNPNGSVESYRARLVAKGYNQVEGVDYFDRFSPVAKIVTVRIILVVDSGFNWPIHQIDINNTFLHGFLDEDRYMTAPDGYSVPIGYAKYFHGLEIAGSSTGTSITQCKYSRDIIANTWLEHFKPASTPLPLGLKLTSHNLPALEDPEAFCRLVGRLMYLGFTRPDISYAAQQLSQFFHRPYQPHMDVAMHLVQYLKGFLDRGLFFPASNSFTLTAYCDADLASFFDTRLSLTSYCVFLGYALVPWKIKKQPTVSRSTTKVEYHSLSATICELQWITFLLQDLHTAVPTPIPLFCDNQAALHIVANPVFHEHIKHLEIDCHLVCDKYKSGFVLPLHISGRQQLLDLFTKLLPCSTFATFLSKMGLVSVTQAHLEGRLLK